MADKYSIADMQNLARQRAGSCLSGKFVDVGTKLRWRCKEGHVWLASATSIIQGVWCKECKKTQQREEWLCKNRAIAREKGGECLATSYLGSAMPILWKCSLGHEFPMSPNNVQRGKWCPECSAGIGERIVREHFEQMFDKPFHKARPEWLKIGKRGRMELDGYCRSLKIAFEHQGMQHYSKIDHFHTSDSHYAARKKYDILKALRCKQRGIRLITIPEVPSMLSTDKLKRYILDSCANMGIRITSRMREVHVDFSEAYNTPFARSKYGELKTIAEQKGGKCLSQSYADAKTKMRWACSEGHRWNALPASILKGHWCKKCASKASGEASRKYDIADMRLVAEKRGGRCLSEKYLGQFEHLAWECAEKHSWPAWPSNILSGQWCPTCAGRPKLSLHDFQTIAKDRGGLCLSPRYVNGRTRMLFQCKEGHEFRVMPDSVRQGHWCQTCAGLKKLTIQEMHELAAQHGGKCLSKRYVNNSAKLKWICADGHKWPAAPAKIKSGQWCPKCAIRRNADRQRLTIEEMQTIARSRGGYCLSKKYINNRTKLKWKCKSSHVWPAAPDKIKAGQWCPRCVGRRGPRI